MEAILGADDFDAETAERYGWINRALPDADLDEFVARLARRIASFPADGIRTAKRVINQITMPAADAFRADAVRFRALVAGDNAQARTAALFAQGLQTRGPLELDLGDRLGALLQMEVTQMPEAGTIDMKLEVVTLPVSDVDRAKRFYQSLGWRLDADIAAARADLVRRGIEISGLFHLAGGPVPGPDPEGRSYQTYASFSDPDGNGWLLQEIKTRLPGREW
jgi:hypothetical protein